MKGKFKIGLKVILIVLAFWSSDLLHAQNERYLKEIEYLKNSELSPDKYIFEKFENADIILLGEDHGIKQNLDFLADLIPGLYEQGVYNIGMEFGAFEMQAKLDSLLSAPQYNEKLAREMMYYYNAGWAYQEYIDVCKAAWKFNKTLPRNAKPFRILNISYHYDWSKYSSGQRTPDMMKGIFPKGTPDKFRAEIVESEVLEKNEKILLLVGMPHAFTTYKFCHPDFLRDNFVDCDQDWLGQRLLRKYPGRVLHILMHRPLDNYPNKTPYLISPANGAIESIMVLNGNKAIGFDLGNAPLGNLRDDSRYSLGYENFNIGQIADGYIFLAPFYKLSGCTVIEDFFESKNWEEIKKDVPDPDWRREVNDLSTFKRQIADMVNIRQRYADVIQN